MKYVFRRKEEKFILPLSVADNIRFIARQGMSLSEFNKGGSLTDIRTTYFENDDYLIYLMKKRELSKRFKVRVREYGYQGKYDSLIWIELKEKTNGQGYKSRFKIEREYLNDFRNGKDIFEHVVSCNKKINQHFLSVLYKRIQNLIIENQLYPRLIMQYQRLALEGNGSKPARLTFDYNLQGGLLNKNDELFKQIKNPEYFDSFKSIVELKIGSDYPDIANAIKKKFNIKSQKFSKFIFGLESCIPDIQQPRINRNKQYIPMAEIINLDIEYDI